MAEPTVSAAPPRDRPRVVDLRGEPDDGRSATFGVLQDPTGRRRARMRLLGGALTTLLVGWLALLALGGLGLVSVDGVPLGGGSLRPVELPALSPGDAARIAAPAADDAATRGDIDAGPSRAGPVPSAGRGGRGLRRGLAPGSPPATAPATGRAPRRARTPNRAPAAPTPAVPGPGRSETAPGGRDTARGNPQ